MIPRLATTSVVLSLAALCGEGSAQERTPRLEPAECPFAAEDWAAGLRSECRWLVVPLHRDRRDGGRARLFVVILRAERPGAMPPLVLLHGGPAESALLTMVRGAARRRPLERDVVIYDQRGAGLSRPDPCPGYARRLRVLEDKEPLGAVGRGARQTAARECAESMRASNVDPAAFSTAANAADLADLRMALGYQRWDVYGASYGARLALEAMRRDPRGIRGVVLENPQPPGVEAAEAPLATQNALQRVLGACARSAACHRAFPAPEQTFFAVFDTLTRAPVSAPPAEEDSARGLSLDGDGFVVAVRSLLRSREGIAFLPLLLDELLRGERLRAARELLRLAEGGAGRPVRATFWLVRCHGEYGPAYRARLDTVRSMVSRPLRALGENLQDCPLWRIPAATDQGTPVESDIPTLIVTGEFDPRTPVEFGRRIAATLSRSYLFELPGETHGGQPVGCRARILGQFLADPHRRPEASCIAAMQPIEFRTQWPQP